MGALRNLIPLAILFAIVGAGAYIGYHIYLWSNEMADRGKKNLEKRNVSFSKDGGMRVGVKGMKEEDYADKTQDYLVKAWNYSSLPAYKSRLWNKEEQVRQKAEAKNRKKYGSSPAVRPASARSTSGAPDVNVPRETRASRSRSSGPGAFPDD